jgi:uncharacterized integral membrane protein
MKLIKIFGLLFLLILVLVFLLKNTDQVTVDLIFKKFEHVSVAFVMLGALTAGILIGYGVVVAQVFATKAENRALRVRNKQITEELNDLRNVAIDEGIYDHEDGDA